MTSSAHWRAPSWSFIGASRFRTRTRSDQPTETSMTSTTKLYLAGPMSDIPGYNFPAFEAATAELRAQKFEVISPAEKDKERDPEAYERARNSPDGKWKPSDTGGLTWAQILSKDIIIVADEVDGLAML